jgi:hypothetical protein
MFYGEQREHLTHCVFMFLSLGQILRDGGKHTPKQVEYKHLDHCANVLLETLRKNNNWYDVATFAGPVSFDQNC